VKVTRRSRNASVVTLRDRGEPTAECVLVPAGWQRGDRALEDRLRRVFRLHAVPEPAIGIAENAVEMAPIEGAERVGVALFRPQHKGCVDLAGFVHS